MLAPKYFSHLAPNNFKIFQQLRLFLFVSPLVQKKKIKLRKPEIATISKSNTFYWNRGISFLRELSDNQIKDLPPGVFSNNTELISLYVTCFFW